MTHLIITIDERARHRVLRRHLLMLYSLLARDTFLSKAAWRRGQRKGLAVILLHPAKRRLPLRNREDKTQSGNRIFS